MMTKLLVQQFIKKTSKNVSNIIRQLIFAGIAIIWIFKETGKNGKFMMDKLLFISALLFVSAIFLELIHYIIELLTMGVYAKSSNLKKELPKWTLISSWFAWGLKIFLTIIAYILIGIHIGNLICCD